MSRWTVLMESTPRCPHLARRTLQCFVWCHLKRLRQQTKLCKDLPVRARGGRTPPELASCHTPEWQGAFPRERAPCSCADPRGRALGTPGQNPPSLFSWGEIPGTSHSSQDKWDSCYRGHVAWPGSRGHMPSRAAGILVMSTRVG